jgi:DNA-binding response OmpR family regulator
VEPILCYPDPPSPDVVRALEIGGYAWQAITDEATATAGVWSAALLSAEGDAEAAFAFARAIRQADGGVAPVLLVVRGAMLTELESRHELFDDFIVSPFHPVEFEARLKHLLVRGGWSEAAAELVTYEELVLNLETYQAIIAGRPLDLTYMEYELLKFLASNPGRVFTRETLLSRVWGYEYYGGARTVDVHVRRLRSKLGEEHAALIQTVRSVGYKFGESRWG